MKFKLRQEYPASLDQLWTIFSDGVYPERKYRQLGATAFRMLLFRASPERIDVVFERRIPLEPDKLPGWAARLRRVLGEEELTLRHSGQWRRLGKQRAEAALAVTVVGGLTGVPIRVHGTGPITELSSRLTRLDLRLTVECDLPLVGGGIARLVAQQMKEEVAADYDYTLAYVKKTKRAGGATSRK